LSEGRNRQIRRMCELVDLAVVDLMRIRIGTLSIGNLPEGYWRHLTQAERQTLIISPR
jgi:23S rRNA pseudouridine2604 synthase